MPKKKDADANIPPAIRKQAEKAEKLQQSLKDPDPGKKVADPEPPKKLEPTHPTPVDPPVIDPATLVAPILNDPAVQIDDGYKAKYEVLQGKYDAEIPALHTQIASLNKVVETLQQTMESNVAATTAAPASGGSQIEKLNPDDLTGYGDDIVIMAKAFNQMIDRNAALEAQVASAAAPNGIGQRIDKLEAEQTLTKEETYYRDLDIACSQWRTLNRLPQFGAWLKQVDKMTGVPRESIIQHAAANMNASQVGVIFNLFLEEVGMPALAPNASNDHLEGQVMPSADLGVNDEFNQTTPKIVYPTTTEFKAALNDFVQKRITEDQYNVIAQNYQLAIKAGKVLP